jgi:IRX15/IRX15L/GXM
MIATRVCIIASGREYQEAAAWAAPTYTRHLASPEAVAVLVPRGEGLTDLLRAHSQRYGFSIGRFPFRQISEHKFTSQLKCQAFLFAVQDLEDGEILFLVDADTFDLKPLALPIEVHAAIRGGRIGLAPDIEDRHSGVSTEPWYLAPTERAPYVNSGVIAASRKSLDLFRLFQRLSRQQRFFRGPFNDQKVINYALGKHFRDRLELLDKSYNGIGCHLSPDTIIGHCAGGAGWLGRQPRGQAHRSICAELLRKGRFRPRRLARVGGGATEGSQSPLDVLQVSRSGFEASFAQAAIRGLMGANQYHYIVRHLERIRATSLLVIGTGYDSWLWYQCAGGKVAYVEDNAVYLRMAPVPPVRYRFTSKVGHWVRAPAIPSVINQPWDAVIVDGPRGYDATCPGRQIPIAWASRLAAKSVFVHDYERPWERSVCDRYLGAASKVIGAEGRKDRHLGLFCLSPPNRPIASQRKGRRGNGRS